MRGGQTDDEKQVIEPGKPPHSRDPEPYLTITYQDIEIERRMWKEPSPPYPCDDCGKGTNASHARPLKIDDDGQVVKYKWICQECADLGAK